MSVTDPYVRMKGHGVMRAASVVVPLERVEALGSIRRRSSTSTLDEFAGSISRFVPAPAPALDRLRGLEFPP